MRPLLLTGLLAILTAPLAAQALLYVEDENEVVLAEVGATWETDLAARYPVYAADALRLAFTLQLASENEAQDGYLREAESNVLLTDSVSFEVALYPEDAPVNVSNFLVYLQDGAYGQSVFHRLQTDDPDTFSTEIAILQGGLLQYHEAGGGLHLRTVPTRDPVALEASRNNRLGTLAAARSNTANSATAQFYFNLANNSGLNRSYSVFGQIDEATIALNGEVGALSLQALADRLTRTPIYNLASLIDPAAETFPAFDPLLYPENQYAYRPEQLLMISDVALLPAEPLATTADSYAVYIVPRTETVTLTLNEGTDEEETLTYSQPVFDEQAFTFGSNLSLPEKALDNQGTADTRDDALEYPVVGTEGDQAVQGLIQLTIGDPSQPILIERTGSGELRLVLEAKLGDTTHRQVIDFQAANRDLLDFFSTLNTSNQYTSRVTDIAAHDWYFISGGLGYISGRHYTAATPWIYPVIFELERIAESPWWWVQPAASNPLQQVYGEGAWVYDLREARWLWTSWSAFPSMWDPSLGTSGRWVRYAGDVTVSTAHLAEGVDTTGLEAVEATDSVVLTGAYQVLVPVENTIDNEGNETGSRILASRNELRAATATESYTLEYHSYWVTVKERLAGANLPEPTLGDPWLIDPTPPPTETAE